MRNDSMRWEGLEAHLALTLLELQGQGQPIDVAPGPEEGLVPPPVRAHRQKRVTVKRGRDRLGQPVDETTVAITSSAEDERAEIDARISALM